MNLSKSIFHALFKEKCWHEFPPKHGPKGEILEGHLVCRCGVSAFDNYIRTGKAIPMNPDYTTSDGFFELKGLLKKKGLQGKFIWWYLERKLGSGDALLGYSNEGVVEVLDNLYDTPLTFATAVYEFLKERDK